jgi:hypothetical protein
MASITVNPTQDYIGQALNNAQNTIFRYKAEQSEKEQAQAQALRQKQEDRRRDITDDENYAGKHRGISTGIGGFKDYEEDAYQIGFEKYKEAKRLYIAGDQSQASVMSKITSGLDGLKNQQAAVNSIKEDAIKNSDNYDPASLKEVSDFIERLDKGKGMSFDDDGNPLYTTFDRDLNGKISDVDKVPRTFQQLLKEITPDPKLDMGAQFIDYKKSLGEQEESTVFDGKNNKDVTTKSYANAELRTIDKVNELVGVESNMRNLRRRNGLSKDDKSKDDEIKASLTTQFRNISRTVVSEKLNLQQANYDLAVSNEAFDRKQTGIVNDRENRKIKGSGTQLGETIAYDRGSTIGQFKFEKGTELTNYTYSGSDNNPKTFSIHKTPSGKSYMTVENKITDEDTGKIITSTKTYNVDSSRADDKTTVNEIATIAGMGGISGLKSVIAKSGKQIVAKTKEKVSEKPTAQDLINKYGNKK